MKYVTSSLLMAILSFFLSSCNGLLVFNMDVLKPGYVVAPADKNSLLLVDNTGVQDSSYGHEVRRNDDFVKDTAFNTEPLSGYFLGSVADYLLQGDFYKKVQIVSREDLKPGKTEKMDFVHAAPLKSSQLRALSKNMDADLLFSLDRLFAHTVTEVHSVDNLFCGVRQVHVNTVWRVFDLKTDTVMFQFQYSDSLFWQKYGYSPESVLKALPKFDSTLREIGDVVAEHVSKCLGPHWESVQRKYYCVGGYRMMLAADQVRAQNMRGAADLWQKEYKKGFGRSVYRAAMNMMLYEEFAGHPKEALMWGDKAKESIESCPFGATSYDTAFLTEWTETLQERVIDYQKLKIYFDDHLN
jgi:hypothetical protein